MAPSTHDADIKSEILFIPELLKEVGAGRIRIPRFQRPFIWTPPKILYLLDSIRRRYPLGSLLFWDTDQKMNSMDRIGDHALPPAREGITSYVLDGQQRLSTLYNVLIPNEKPETWIWQVWYDLESEEFTHRGQQKHLPAHWLPIWALFDAYEFHEVIDTLKDGAASKEKAKAYVKEAQDLAETFRQFRIPVTRILRTNLDEAVQIFSRINSSGVKISPDQMASSLTYREALKGQTVFNLSDEIDQIQRELAEHRFGNIDRVIILRSLQVELELDAYRISWASLRSQGMSQRVPKGITNCRKTLVRTIKFLKRIGVGCDSLLPYSMQLVVLSAFFRHCPGKIDPTRAALLTRWFWVTSFTGWFAGGNSTTVRQAVQDMTLLAKGAKAEFESLDINERALPFPQNFDFRSARVKTQLLCQLNQATPLDFQGRKTDPWHLLNHLGYKAMAYVYRKSSILFRSPANRILVDVEDTTNTRERLQAMSKDPITSSDSVKILHSHAITQEALSCLGNGNPADFVKARHRHLKTQELSFMKQQKVSLPTENESVSDVIIDNEDPTLEEAFL